MNTEKDYTYDTVNINIPVGSRSFSQDKSLKDGTCVGVKFIPIGNTERANIINVSILSTDGSAIIPSTDFRDYENNGGGYKANFKPCNFNSRLDVGVNVTSTEAIATADFVGQVVFMIEKDQPLN